MSRRHRAQKRKIEPDFKYKSILISKLINCIMLHGKKTLATRIVYDALELFGKKVHADNPLIAFEEVMEKAMPSLEVKSRRIGGATYQVPVEISPERRTALAMGWIIGYARAKAGKSMTDGLAAELIDIFNEQGQTIKKKDDTHKMAEANKAFAHYKW